ncbi:hypothetical protein [Virgibacillus halodenitrificans]|uniref:hypothetical protein n=1 Tax=Virgibacillus halodenitrificans TaxID=1482 RepID=UPI000EF54353|nr:hypothetical protein [Virgibacillus halodenitrificans]
MLLEKIFNQLEYVSYKRIDGIGIFDATEPEITFYYGKRETLFSDGTLTSDNPNTCERVYCHPTYVIAAINYNKDICNDPTQISFEVYLADDKEETVEKVSLKLKELVYEVHSRIKMMRQRQRV